MIEAAAEELKCTLPFWMSAYKLQTKLKFGFQIISQSFLHSLHFRYLPLHQNKDVHPKTRMQNENYETTTQKDSCLLSNVTAWNSTQVPRKNIAVGFCPSECTTPAKQDVLECLAVNVSCSISFHSKSCSQKITFLFTLVPFSAYAEPSTLKLQLVQFRSLWHFCQHMKSFGKLRQAGWQVDSR